MFGVGKLKRIVKSGKKIYKTKKNLNVKRTKQNASTQTKKMKRRYKTRGYRSMNFRKPRLFKHDFYAKHGSIIKVETGGEVSDAHCVYVGFCTNPIDITHKAVGRAIVKEIWSQFGNSITRFDDVFAGVGFVYDLEVLYMSTPVASSLNVLTVTLGTNPTYQTIVDDFVTQMVNLCLLVPRLMVDSIRLVERNVPQATAQVRGEISAGNFGLYISSSGTISVQNRSRGSDNSVSNTDITNNPLHGKIYSGIGNHFEVRSFVNSGASSPFFVEGNNPAFGVQSQDYQVPVSRKPFSAQDLLGVRRVTDTTLQPGEIRSGSLYYSKKINLKNFYRDYHDAIAAPTFETHKLGKIYMVGLEKMVNDRVSEPDISVGFEVNLTLKCAGIYRRKVETVTIVQEIN